MGQGCLDEGPVVWLVASGGEDDSRGECLGAEEAVRGVR